MSITYGIVYFIFYCNEVKYHEELISSSSFCFRTSASYSIFSFAATLSFCLRLRKREVDMTVDHLLCHAVVKERRKENGKVDAKTEREDL